MFIKPFFFCCFCFSSLLSSSSLSVSLEILDTSVFLVIFLFFGLVNQHILTKLLNFFLTFDFKDTSSLIIASGDIRKFTKLSKTFNLRNSAMFIFSLSHEEYFFILKHFSACTLVLVSAKNILIGKFTNFSFDLFFFTLFCVIFVHNGIVGRYKRFNRSNKIRIIILILCFSLLSLSLCSF